jgi:2-iminobutanoate/2-iminopropanoate deaminase
LVACIRSGKKQIGAEVQLRKITKMVANAATPGGQYSHAVIAGDLIFVSCQEPADQVTGEKPEGFAEQVAQCLRNLQTILRGVGSDLEHVVKVNAYLSDIGRFAEFNAVYREFFAVEPPARTTVGCHLDGTLIEMDCVAILPE